MMQKIQLNSNSINRNRDDLDIKRLKLAIIEIQEILKQQGVELNFELIGEDKFVTKVKTVLGESEV